MVMRSVRGQKNFIHKQVASGGLEEPIDSLKDKTTLQEALVVM